MNKTLPNYLKVHRGPDQQNAPSLDAPSHAGPPADSVEQFWNDFTCTTGWRLDRRARRRSKTVQVLPTVSDIDLGSVLENTSGSTLDAIIDPAQPYPASPHGPTHAPESPATHSRHELSKKSATRLAEAADRLTTELTEARDTLRHQSMELAARASLMAGADETTPLADRIESLLGDAAAACHCDAAVLYLLDDNTEFLEGRAAFGISSQTLAKPPRHLRGSRGDLEAMVRDVVTIDDFAAGSIDTWNPPETFAAGICVVIKSVGVPIGTLWLFANKTTEFGKSETAAARLVASAISLELSSASQRRDTHTEKQETSTVHEVATWQQESLPVGSNLAEHWRVDGMIDSPQEWATGWHAWDVLPDGTLMLAIAEAVERSIVGAMHAAVARSALSSHTGYRHTPAQILGRVSDTLWQTSTGEQLVSMLYARIDPETGEGEVASAGNITAMVGNKYGYRPLVDGRGEPLNSHIDARPTMRTFRLLAGETMLAYTQGMNTEQLTQRCLGTHLRRSMRAGERNPLAAIRRELASAPLTTERGAVSLLRI
ncbi:PP2C family protein-serine/threonine phosphatase [Rubripirellula lacrimiformis]|uniref:PP2C family protein-serine/threonine phosphatase n=1 Tax=Rubripirellula lacrimiformis TaxID=1930273 RepID=UPI001C54C257|nr:SpoIIE family protein phosphatase [Rubripirellula lacrimiformis]